MNQPTPRTIEEGELVALAQAVIAADRFPQLATIDEDQPRVRPVSPVRTEGFTVYIANLRSYHKTAEIRPNPRVELCYLDSDHNQVRLTGVAEVVTESELLREIWEANPLLRQYLGSMENSDLIIYRIAPSKVRFMQEWALQYYDVPIETTI